jgi:hypothetical protein
MFASSLCSAQMTGRRRRSRRYVLPKPPLCDAGSPHQALRLLSKPHTDTHTSHRRWCQHLQTLSGGWPHPVAQVAGNGVTAAQLPPGECPVALCLHLCLISHVRIDTGCMDAHSRMPTRRVVVLQEEDPKPSAILGRFSFKCASPALDCWTMIGWLHSLIVRSNRQFNVQTERLASAAEESIRRVADEVVGRERGVASVGEAAMTAALGGQKGGAGGKRARQTADDLTPAAAPPPFKRPPAFDGGAFGGGGGGSKTQRKTR